MSHVYISQSMLIVRRLDASRLHIIGHSSGAHLTSMLLTLRTCQVANVDEVSAEAHRLARVLGECGLDKTGYMTLIAFSYIHSHIILNDR